MKKIYIITLLLLTGVFAQAQTSVWDGSRQLWTRGTGTEEDPFLIESAANLAYLSYMVGKAFNTEGMYFKLTTDIDLNGSEDQQWMPIGLVNDAYYEDGCVRNTTPVCVGDYSDLTFKGHFDGDGHSISNIYINEITGTAGLFGALTATEGQTVVENVFVTSGYIKASRCGGIVGTCNISGLNRALVSHCWNGAEIDGSYAGGIVGDKADMVRNCYNVAAVNGSATAGGIVGGSAVEVLECYNNGAISSDCYSGGILGGSVRGGSTFRNCYNTGSVASTGTNAPGGSPGSIVGGIVGFVWMGENTMSNCYNVGRVSGETCEPGGVLGAFGNNGTTDHVYYLNTCNGTGEGEAMDAEAMRAPEFVETLNQVDPVWCADTLNTNDGYPILGANNLAVDEHAVTVLTVYPNPTSGQFTVEGTGSLSVFNVVGQTVMTLQVNEKTVVELPQGLYFIRLEGENNTKLTKLIVR